MTRRWKGWLFGSVNTHTQRIMSTFTLKVFVDIMHINKRSKHARVIDEGVCVCLWDRAHVNQCGSLCVWYMGRYRVTASQQYPLFGANITYPSVSWSHTHTHRFSKCVTVHRSSLPSTPLIQAQFMLHEQTNTANCQQSKWKMCCMSGSTGSSES